MYYVYINKSYLRAAQLSSRVGITLREGDTKYGEGEDAGTPGVWA